MKAIILAGGSGTRLWPASTASVPKQFLDINGEGALLSQTLHRMAQFCPEEHIHVITREEYGAKVGDLMADFSELAQDNIILEPCPRNTCAAILLSAKYLESKSGSTLDDVMLVLPSDHLIEDTHKNLEECFVLGRQLAKDGHIVVFGIVPDKPETGYGYIKLNRQMPPGDLPFQWLAQGVPVQAFVEKPHQRLAEEYLASGEYLWNAGMFAMSLRTLYTELAAYFPECQQFLEMDYRALLHHFEDIPKTSFDIAVMEKTSRAVVIPMNINWSDVGSWDSVYDVLPKDDNLNAVQGKAIIDSTYGCLIMNKTEQPMAISGMENMIVVKTEDGVLSIPRGESQKIGALTATINQPTPLPSPALR